MWSTGAVDRRLGIAVLAACAAAASLAGLIDPAAKPITYDETITLQRLAGDTKQEIAQQLGSASHRIGDLRRYQCGHAGSSHGRTALSLATEDAHPPLYFLGLHAWSAIVGCDLARLRAASAILIGLSVLAAFWLTGPIFGRLESRLAFTATVAASPLVLVYAQEARPYALFLLLVLVSTGAWLRLVGMAADGRRHPGSRALWWAYGIATSLGALTHTLFFLTIAGQVVAAVLVVPSREARHRLRRIVWPAIVAGVVFAAWMAVKIVASKGVTLGAAFTWAGVPPGFVLRRLVLLLAGVFVDPFDPAREAVWLTSGGTLNQLPLPDLLGVGAALGLVATAGLAVAVRGSRLLAATCLALAWPTVLYLAKDVTLGGSLAAVPRYQVTTAVAICLSVAWLVDRLGAVPGRRRLAAWLLLALILVAQGMSNRRYLRAEYWWNTAGEHESQLLAQAIAGVPDALIVADRRPAGLVHLLRLVYHVPGQVEFRLAGADELGRGVDEAGSRPVFLFGFLPREVAASGIRVDRFTPLPGASGVYRVAPGTPADDR